MGLNIEKIIHIVCKADVTYFCWIVTNNTLFHELWDLKKGLKITCRTSFPNQAKDLHHDSNEPYFKIIIFQGTYFLCMYSLL